MTGRFDALLRQARLQAGLTQEQLAQRSGVGVRTIRGLETGERVDPRPSTARRLADALGLAPDDRGRLLAAAVGDPAPPHVTRPAARNDLPGDVADFTGRAEEMDRLLATIPLGDASRTAVVIEAIDGMAGVGKTALAVHVAHRLVDRYPDGALFIDLHGHASEHGATDPATALDALLRAVGVSGDQIPDGLDRRASLWRAKMAERKALVVLDNAADAAQVRPLLPGSPGCLALVTSRHRLADLETAHILSLDVLPVGDAIALFNGIAGPERVAAQQEAVAEVARLCGYLPLAIRIAAARLGSRPAWTVEHLAGRLRERRSALAELTTGDRSVAAAFTLSYQHLAPEQRRLFRLLGLHPGPDIDRHAAAALADRDADTTERALEDLVDAHLLQQPVLGRYRFHDLLAQHAQHTARDTDPEEDRRAALTRLVDHYLHTAFAADRLINATRAPIPAADPVDGFRPPPLEDEVAALAWFEAEHTNLLATQQAAGERGWHTPVWQLAWTLDTFHRLRGHLHDNLAVWRVGLTATERSGDPAADGLAHRLLGRAYVLAGLHADGIRHLRRAMTQAESAGDDSDRAHIHTVLLKAWGEQGDDRRALEHASSALRLFTTLDDLVRKAEALNNVGWHQARLGDHEQGRAHCQAALDLHRRLGHRYGEAITLDSLGYIGHLAGQYTRALHYYQQALALYRDLGDAYDEANTLINVAQTHEMLGRPEESRAALGQALRLYHHQGRQQDAERVQRQLDASR